MGIKVKLTEGDFHSHLKARMMQRGITKEEIEKTLTEGWEANDVKIGTVGKVFVFPYNNYWEGKFYEEKEVSVYYKYIRDSLVLLTVKAKYGKEFSKRRMI